MPIDNVSIDQRGTIHAKKALVAFPLLFLYKPQLQFLFIFFFTDFVVETL